MRDHLRKLVRRINAPVFAVMRLIGWEPGKEQQERAELLRGMRCISREQWRAWFQANRRRQRRQRAHSRLSGWKINPRSANLLRFVIELSRPAPVPRSRARQLRADRGPSGTSWRSLKRAVNAGWKPPQLHRSA